MPLTRIEELKEEQRARVKAFQDLLDKHNFVLSKEFRASMLAHMSVISQTAFQMGREEMKGV